MRNEELREATTILRSHGFSRAWILDNDEPTEIVFLVLPKELARADEIATTKELMVAFPGRKVGLAAHVPIRTRSLY